MARHYIEHGDDDSIFEDAASGDRVELLADADRPGGFVVLLDRVRQSYVDPDDPTYLDFEYIRWLAHAIDTLADGPIAATHIGGGGGTLVRYISATRPGSTHIVLEPDESVTELVRARLPYRRGTRIRVRPVDGRTGLAALKDASADLIVLDAFDGGRVPADLTTAESLAEVARVLRPGGLFVANVGDGAPLRYTRRLMAGVLGVFPHAMVITDKTVLNSHRYGNIGIVASPSPLEEAELRRALAAEPFPCTPLTGAQLADWVGHHRPFTDADAERSPAPPEASWRVSLE